MGIWPSFIVSFYSVYEASIRPHYGHGHAWKPLRNRGRHLHNADPQISSQYHKPRNL